MLPRAIAVTAVVLGLAAPSGLAAGAKGWHGKTSQGFGMVFYLNPSGKLVKLAQAHYKLTCSDGSSQTSGFGVSIKTGDTVPVAKDGTYGVSGKIKSGVPGKGNGTAAHGIRGRVTNAKVTGSFRIDFKLDDGMTCTSGRVTYTLR